MQLQHILEDPQADADVKLAVSKLVHDSLERKEAAKQGLAAMERLAEVLRGRSGQPYKVRAILYSLWNGKPCPVNELLGLDWPIRKDLVAVLLAFGYEDHDTKFFYQAVQKAITHAGQWGWFLQEAERRWELE